METLENIANWFLEKESKTKTGLNCLCYYAQAYHLAFYGKPLFKEKIRASASYPRILELKEISFPIKSNYNGNYEEDFLYPTKRAKIKKKQKTFKRNS